MCSLATKVLTWQLLGKTFRALENHRQSAANASKGTSVWILGSLRGGGGAHTQELWLKGTQGPTRLGVCSPTPGSSPHTPPPCKTHTHPSTWDYYIMGFIHSLLYNTNMWEFV